MATYTKQPCAMDARGKKDNPTGNYSGEPLFINADSGGNYTNRLFIRFDASDIPPYSEITAAEIHLNYYDKIADPAGKAVSVYHLTRQDWVEAEASWNNYKSGSSWTAAGGDYVTSNPTGGSTSMPSSYGWVIWNILAILQHCFSEHNKQIDVLVRFSNELDNVAAYLHAKEYTTDPNLQPKLVVTYTPIPQKPTVDTLTPTNVASNSATLEAEVTEDGGETVDYVGFVWGKSSKSDPGDVVPASAGYDSYWQSSQGSYGENPFDHATGDTLDAATIYYYRGCAHNVNGWAYGDEVQFQTLAKFRFKTASDGPVMLGATPVEGAYVAVINKKTLDIFEGLTDQDGHVTIDITGVADEDADRHVWFRELHYERRAALTTDLTGNDNDLKFTASNTWPGKAGHKISIEYVDPQLADQTLSIDITPNASAGFDITVNLATDGGGAITSTAAQIKAAIEADPDATELVSVALYGTETGAGLVTAMAKMALSGGNWYNSDSLPFMRPVKVS